MKTLSFFEKIPHLAAGAFFSGSTRLLALMLALAVVGSGFAYADGHGEAEDHSKMLANSQVENQQATQSEDPSEILSEISSDISSEISSGQICKVSDEEDIYDLIFSEIEPFDLAVAMGLEPEDDKASARANFKKESVNDRAIDQGTEAGESPVEVRLRDRHFYEQTYGFPEVRMPLDAYVAQTHSNHNSIEPFESKITVIFPDCSEASLMRGELQGQPELDFDLIRELLETARQHNHAELKRFVLKQVSPTPIAFDDLLALVRNDYRADIENINDLLPENLRSMFLEEGEIPVEQLGESLALSLAAHGGTSNGDVKDLFVILPKYSAGISDQYNAIILDDRGEIHRFVDLDTSLIGKIFTRMGYRVDYIFLSSVQTSGGGACEIDLAGHWVQGSGGSHVRFCPFFSLLEDMLMTGAYRNLPDYDSQRSAFARIDQILSSAE